MLEVYIDEHNPNLMRWSLNQKTKWGDFDKAIDDLADYAQSRSKPFSVIATTTGQMPRGNALSHLQKLIRTTDAQPMLERFIIVNHRHNPIGQTFVAMALKMFSNQDKISIVTSEEAALERI